MDISASHSSPSRTVTASNNSSADRATQTASDTKVEDRQNQDRANEQRVAEKNQQKRDDERRLEGRLVNYGQKKGETPNDYKQLSYNRSRVDDAYKAPKTDVSNAHAQQQQRAHDNEAIDIVV